MQKAFKVRLQPNQKQQTQINKTIGCARFVYNRFLALRKELYETEKKNLNYNGCSQQLTLLKKELTWLAEVDKFALQNSLKNLETSYKNFFESLKKSAKKVGFPKFKKKHGFKQSYKTNFTNNNIEVREHYIKLPKLGWVKFHKSQEITGKLVNVTVSLTKNGHYMASILCETEIDKYPDSSKELGLDLGIKSYLVTSLREEINNPKYYKKHLKKLKKAHKNLSRKQKGSSNSCKAKIKLARMYAQITNVRDDFLHKLSTRFVKEYGIICIEDLRVANLVKNHKLAQAISDTSWSKFVSMLEYKANWHDRIIQKVSPFYPSSQTCSCCDSINHKVKDLSVREWVCSSCNTTHLRVNNAATNILREGIRLLAAKCNSRRATAQMGLGGSISEQLALDTAVGATEVIKNACGHEVRLGVTQALVSEAGITRL